MLRRSELVGIVMLLPFLVWLVVFAYAPLAGLVVSFRAFSWSNPFGGRWVGFENFRFLFGDVFFRNAAVNTLIFVVLKSLLALSLPAFLAFSLRGAKKSTSYTFSGLILVTYFTSWVIMSLAVRIAVSPQSWAGLIGGTSLLNVPSDARWVFIVSDVFKSFGWVFFVYLLSFRSIDEEYWELAELEGATKTQVFLRVAAPMLAPTIAVVTLLTVTGFFDSSVDQALNLSHPGIYSGSDVIGSYAYRTAIRTGHIARGTAASVVEIVLRIMVVGIAFGVGSRALRRLR